MIKILKSKSGVTLMELMATIIVGSIVTMILLQILVLSVNARTQLELENKMQNESYYISEQIRFNIFNLEPQEIELIIDDDDETIIYIKHLYDYTTNPGGDIIPDTSNPVTDILRLDKLGKNIYYNGVKMNDPSILIEVGSLLELISIEPGVCDLVNGDACDQGIIKLTLQISVILADGSVINSQEYITTILV